MNASVLRAEFRKLRASPTWWALLLPAVVVTYLISLLGASISELPDSETLRQLGGAFPSLLGVSLTYSVGFTSLLVMSMGIAAFAGEVRRKILATTYLTSGARGGVLLAKLTAYGCLGGVYGIAIMGAATLGGLTIGGWSAFPPINQFLSVAAVGVVVVVLWSLFGVGLGALLPYPVFTIAGAVLVRLAVERLAGGALSRLDNQWLADLLPSTAATSFTSRLAGGFAAGQAPRRTRANFEDLLVSGGMSWWTAGLVFAGWTLACCLAAWWVCRVRDVN